MFLTSENLSPIDTIRHGFFMRTGGVSEGIYASLNCGARGTGDSAEAVDQNRSRVAHTIGTSHTQLLSLCQIHSNNVITVRDAWSIDDRPQADAMVTDRPGIALGILTADCAPLLFADIKSAVIGAAHSGWKGALAQIGHSTVHAMVSLGARPAYIAAAIGPSIAKASYEVSGDFRQKFLDRERKYEKYFIAAERTGHWFFDLKLFIHDSLLPLGLHSINILENDTYLEESSFFSYRRATHRSETGYGRQISAIMLKG